MFGSGSQEDNGQPCVAIGDDAGAEQEDKAPEGAPLEASGLIIVEHD